MPEFVLLADLWQHMHINLLLNAVHIDFYDVLETRAKCYVFILGKYSDLTCSRFRQFQCLVLEFLGTECMKRECFYFATTIMLSFPVQLQANSGLFVLD